MDNDVAQLHKKIILQNIQMSVLRINELEKQLDLQRSILNDQRHIMMTIQNQIVEKDFKKSIKQIIESLPIVHEIPQPPISSGRFVNDELACRDARAGARLREAPGGQYCQDPMSPSGSSTPYGFEDYEDE